MSLELLKVVCQVVVLERDEDGKPVGERSSEPVAIYDTSGFDEFVSNVRAEIAAAGNGRVEEKIELDPIAP